MLDNKGFDILSEEYYDVLNFVYNLTDRKDNSKILDIGVGTGMLTNQLYKVSLKIELYIHYLTAQGLNRLEGRLC